MDHNACAFYKGTLDFSQAAVVVGGEGEPSYLPFAEDWRGGLIDLAHPACFVEAEGWSPSWLPWRATTSVSGASRDRLVLLLSQAAPREAPAPALE